MKTVFKLELWCSNKIYVNCTKIGSTSRSKLSAKPRRRVLKKYIHLHNDFILKKLKLINEINCEREPQPVNALITITPSTESETSLRRHLMGAPWRGAVCVSVCGGGTGVRRVGVFRKSG